MPLRIDSVLPARLDFPWVNVKESQVLACNTARRLRVPVSIPGVALERAPVRVRPPLPGNRLVHMRDLAGAAVVEHDHAPLVDLANDKLRMFHGSYSMGQKTTNCVVQSADAPHSLTYRAYLTFVHFVAKIPIRCTSFCPLASSKRDM